jgi:CheY-like chemotaxis protein/two-component sensor histidine kinase
VAVDLQAVDAAALARQVVGLMQPQAALRSQRLWLEGDLDAAPPVLADKRALRQVLINLVGNALKYTPEGGQVWLQLHAEPGRSLRLDVCDDGPGMDAATQARLFRPFERGDRADDETPGTGLGLVISRQLVRAMRGQLRLRSSPGQGSVFSVELPLAAEATVAPLPEPAHAPPPDSQFGSLPAAEAAVPPLPAARLLYVEDDPVNRLLMQEFVARMPPLQLHLADNLAEGLRAARSLQPELVLLDMNLPDGNGCSLLAQLRAEPATAALRVVALSADALPAQVQQALAAGFDDYLTKPLDFRLLQRKLAAWLAAPGQASDS